MSSFLLPALLALAPLQHQPLEGLAVEVDRPAPRQDWLIDPAPFRARVVRSVDGKALVLTNGLVRREIRVDPGATVALDDLTRGASVLRGVKPEARVTIDGIAHDVGGLVGQANYAFLRRDQVDELEKNPAALHCTGFEVVPTETPFAWKRVRWHEQISTWPPTGIGAAWSLVELPQRVDR